MADADALRGAGVPGPRSTPPPGPEAAPPPPPAAPVEITEGGPVMSLVDHLTELRSRIIRVVLAVVVGSAIGFTFAGQIIQFLHAPMVRALPAGADTRLLNLAPGDAFVIYVRVAVVFGIIVAMPVILYQVWAFVSPGLTSTERRIAAPWIPFALLFFALGVGIAYFTLEFALRFLLGFGGDVFQNQLGARQYFDFVTTMSLAFGIVLEFPIVLFGLSRVGIVTSDRLKASRRYVMLGMALFAAIITPGGDPVSFLALGGTMYILFELTTWVIRRTGK
jgi:sec-independent protein translocase protein TatC